MAEGDIGTVVASLEFDTDRGFFPDIVQVADDVFAIAYAGAGNDGWIKTVTIDALGAIAFVAGGSLEFDTDCFDSVNIVHVADDVFAIVYTGYFSRGQVITVTIDALGAIALVDGGNLQFSATSGEHPTIIHVADDVFAIAYRSAGGAGSLTTVTIDALGAIAFVAGGSLEFDADDCNYPDIVHVADDVFAIVYYNSDNDGWIKTVTIDALGNLALVGGGSREFETGACFYPKTIHVADDVFAIVHSSGALNCRIETRTIDALGAIGAALIEEFSVVGTGGGRVNIVNISGDVFAIVHRRDSGWTATLTIDAAGQIGDAVIDEKEFEAVNCNYPKIINVSASMYAVAYTEDVTNDGWVKTFTITTIPSGAGPKHLMMMGIG